MTREIKAAENDKQRSELAEALAENEKNHAELLQKIEATWLEFETQQTKAQPYIQVRAKNASPATVQELTQALAAETERCESVTQQAASIRQQRNAFEAELAASNQQQTQLRTELGEQRQLLETLTQAYKIETTNLTGQLKGLENSQLDSAGEEDPIVDASIGRRQAK